MGSAVNALLGFEHTLRCKEERRLRSVSRLLKNSRFDSEHSRIRSKRIGREHRSVFQQRVRALQIPQERQRGILSRRRYLS